MLAFFKRPNQRHQATLVQTEAPMIALTVPPMPQSPQAQLARRRQQEQLEHAVVDTFVAVGFFLTAETENRNARMSRSVTSVSLSSEDGEEAQLQVSPRNTLRR